MQEAVFQLSKHQSVEFMQNSLHNSTADFIFPGQFHTHIQNFEQQNFFSRSPSDSASSGYANAPPHTLTDTHTPVTKLRATQAVSEPDRFPCVDIASHCLVHGGCQQYSLTHNTHIQCRAHTHTCIHTHNHAHMHTHTHTQLYYPLTHSSGG